MDIRDLREIIGLTQAQVADELGVPRQEVIDITRENALRCFPKLSV